MNWILIDMDFKTFYLAFHDPLWVLLLSLVLFFPVRQLIWILYVRKKQKTQKDVSDDEKKNFKKKSNIYFNASVYCF